MSLEADVGRVAAVVLITKTSSVWKRNIRGLLSTKSFSQHIDLLIPWNRTLRALPSNVGLTTSCSQFSLTFSKGIRGLYLLTDDWFLAAPHYPTLISMDVVVFRDISPCSLYVNVRSSETSATYGLHNAISWKMRRWQHSKLPLWEPRILDSFPSSSLIRGYHFCGKMIWLNVCHPFVYIRHSPHLVPINQFSLMFSS
jgi:hypothetical protein